MKALAMYTTQMYRKCMFNAFVLSKIIWVREEVLL